MNSLLSTIGHLVAILHQASNLLLTIDSLLPALYRHVPTPWGIGHSSSHALTYVTRTIHFSPNTLAHHPSISVSNSQSASPPPPSRITYVYMDIRMHKTFSLIGVQRTFREINLTVHDVCTHASTKVIIYASKISSIQFADRVKSTTRKKLLS